MITTVIVGRPSGSISSQIGYHTKKNSLLLVTGGPPTLSILDIIFQIGELHRLRAVNGNKDKSAFTGMCNWHVK